MCTIKICSFILVSVWINALKPVWSDSRVSPCVADLGWSRERPLPENLHLPYGSRARCLLDPLRTASSYRLVRQHGCDYRRGDGWAATFQTDLKKTMLSKYHRTKLIPISSVLIFASFFNYIVGIWGTNKSNFQWALQLVIHAWSESELVWTITTHNCIIVLYSCFVWPNLTWKICIFLSSNTFEVVQRYLTKFNSKWTQRNLQLCHHALKLWAGIWLMVHIVTAQIVLVQYT